MDGPPERSVTAVVEVPDVQHVSDCHGSHIAVCDAIIRLVGEAVNSIKAGPDCVGE